MGLGSSSGGILCLSQVHALQVQTTTVDLSSDWNIYFYIFVFVFVFCLNPNLCLMISISKAVVCAALFGGNYI